ncbi:MAG TPA: cupin domain-containing protein [Nitrolancea sp.]|jgi:quercetin dioxygenase-like cupin family protein|nr:cupin domain-containing protein [Nitrolancea sp.]
MSIIRGAELQPFETPGGNRTTALATPSRGASDLSVIRQQQQPGGRNPTHHHDREEIMVMLAGEIALFLDDEPRGLVRGDIAIIPANVAHRIENQGTEPAEWLLVAPSGVRFFQASGEEAFPEWSR